MSQSEDTVPPEHDPVVQAKIAMGLGGMPCADCKCAALYNYPGVKEGRVREVWNCTFFDKRCLEARSDDSMCGPSGKQFFSRRIADPPKPPPPPPKPRRGIIRTLWWMIW